jgi:hypothetical protein
VKINWFYYLFILKFQQKQFESHTKDLRDEFWKYFLKEIEDDEKQAITQIKPSREEMINQTMRQDHANNWSCDVRVSPLVVESWKIIYLSTVLKNVFFAPVLKNVFFASVLKNVFCRAMWTLSFHPYQIKLFLKDLIVSLWMTN